MKGAGGFYFAGKMITDSIRLTDRRFLSGVVLSKTTGLPQLSGCRLLADKDFLLPRWSGDIVNLGTSGKLLVGSTRPKPGA